MRGSASVNALSAQRIADGHFFNTGNRNDIGARCLVNFYAFEAQKVEKFGDLVF
jgi:hypothetical protein